MWIVSGPMSTAPLDGEGIEARRLIRRRSWLEMHGQRTGGRYMVRELHGSRAAQCGILPARSDASLRAGGPERLTPGGRPGVRSAERVAV
jgi:hypothetical protein